MRELRGAWGAERGFTLPEVLTAVILMGILFTIASSTWLRVVHAWMGS